MTQSEAPQSAPLRFDIELTNRCNARCSFCPRDETPQTGLISVETFEKALDRALELDSLPKVESAGQGEPCLHPHLVDFARMAQRRGVGYGITTNGSLLSPEISEGLHDAELERIVFSFGDLGADYEEVYALNFEQSYSNVMHFLELNARRKNPADTSLSVVLHDINREKVRETAKFWRKRGVKAVLPFEQNNRGGACDNGHHFVHSTKYIEEAKEILEAQGASIVCFTPFLYLFVGWNGQYYICCNDYRKSTPLGSIFDFSISEMDEIKRELMIDGGMSVEACRECSQNPINNVREGLFELERGRGTETQLMDRVAKHGGRRLPIYQEPISS